MELNSSELLSQLPTDKSQLSSKDLEILNTFFKNQQKVVNLFTEFKDIFIAGIIFLILNLPFVDGIIKGLISCTAKSSIIFLIVKTGIFVLLLFVINNWVLTRAKKE